METQSHQQSRGRYYIGIDSGGTKTRALLTDASGLVLGAGFSGSANRNHHTRDQVRQSLCQAICAALAGLPPRTVPTVLYLGMSGVSTESDRQEILGIMREIPEAGPDSQVIVDNDTVPGLTGGLAGQPGMALVAGTGSACLGVDAHGERFLCGGWGALADDAGSAPWIGIRALQAAVRAQDGRIGPTALQSIVFDFLGLTEPRQLIHRVHHLGLERAEIGQLAPLVAAACQEGDAAARMILEEAAAELSLMASATARKLFGTAPCEMILVGGLARSGPPFQAMLMDRLHQDVPSLRVAAPLLSPAAGAVLEALRVDGIAWTPQILANLAAHSQGT